MEHLIHCDKDIHIKLWKGSLLQNLTLEEKGSMEANINVGDNCLWWSDSDLILCGWNVVEDSCSGDQFWVYFA